MLIKQREAKAIKAKAVSFISFGILVLFLS